MKGDRQMQPIGLSLGASVGLALVLCGAFPASAQIAPDLGDAQDFAVLGGSTVTNTGDTVITGNLGVWPGTALTGFPPGVVVDGTIHLADAVAQSAQSSVTAAYVDLESQPCDVDLTGTDLGGLTLTEGVYCFDSSAQLTGTLTLDAEGNPDAVFIFQTGSTITTASGSTVALINGASECEVFWQVGSSATLGTGTDFLGSVLALQSITLDTGTSVAGRTLARNGAVTLDSNTVNVETCASGQFPPPCPAITLSPETLPDATVGVPYSETFTATGGTEPYTFSVSSGELPPGLTLTSEGVLSGTPTEDGDFTFTILATDANGCFALRTYTMFVLTDMPTLPQVFVVLLALGLTAAGYFRLRQARAA